MSQSTDSRAPTLADRLRERIKRHGPITFHDWMQAALYDERDGYYCRAGRVHQGRAGDYRTAPETSPLFAATFAKYFAKTYFDLGAPKRWTIVEVGGGPGEFAQGVLKSLRSKPEAYDGLAYLFEEMSASSRARAVAALAEFSDKVFFRSPTAGEAVGEGIPGGAALPHGRASDTIIFSNELVDAFPVHRVIGRGGKLKELNVALNASGDFVWTENELSPRAAEYCDRIELKLEDGQIYEINIAVEDFMRHTGELLESGLLITVDYGAERYELLNDPNRFKGTLRSFRRHNFGKDVLSAPGGQDLTSTVDWTQLVEAGERNGFETLRLERLDKFLVAEGAIEELTRAAQTTEDEAELFNLNAGAREMILPTGMASYFQVLVQRRRR